MLGDGPCRWRGAAAPARPPVNFHAHGATIPATKKIEQGLREVRTVEEFKGDKKGRQGWTTAAGNGGWPWQVRATPARDLDGLGARLGKEAEGKWIGAHGL